VMHEGQIAGELAPGEATEEKIMTLATGGYEQQQEGAGAQTAYPRPANRLGGIFSWLRATLSGNKGTILTIYGLLITLIMIAAVLSPHFRTLTNFQNILRQSVALGLVSIGQTIVIIAGGIDISVSSIISLTVVLTAGIMDGQMGMAVPAVLSVLALGALIGLFNGMLVTKLNLPAFIATFGTWSIVRGIVLLYTRGPVGLIPRPFRFLADGHIGPVPFPVIILALAFLIAILVMARAPFGRYVRAVGGNPEVARLSGIRVQRIQVATYVTSALLAVVAGLFLSARMGVGDPNVGVGFEWDSITAAVIGGANWLGGGSLAGTLGGVLIIITLNNVMNQLGINFWYQQVFKGLILLMAVIFYRRNR
jgi:ribose transport system permease protein